MDDKQLVPGSPEAVALVIERIRSLSREDWLARFRAYPDWDESWLEAPSRKLNGHARRSRVVTVRSRLRTLGS